MTASVSTKHNKFGREGIVASEPGARARGIIEAPLASPTELWQCQGKNGERVLNAQVGLMLVEILGEATARRAEVNAAAERGNENQAGASFADQCSWRNPLTQQALR